MRTLKVKFDGKLVHQIMNEERGASLRLLFQLKLAIERSGEVSDPTRSGITETMTGLKPIKVEKHLKEVESLKHSVIPGYISKTLSMTKGSTLIGKPIDDTFKGYVKTNGLKKKMEIFDYRKMKLEEKAFQDKLAEEDLVFRMQQDARE